jgi:hypothetical protein
MRTQRCIPAPRAKTVANAIRGRMKKWFFYSLNVKMTGPPTFTAKPPPVVVGPCQLACYVSRHYLHEQVSVTNIEPGERTESSTWPSRIMASLKPSDFKTTLTIAVGGMPDEGNTSFTTKPTFARSCRTSELHNFALPRTASAIFALSTAPTRRLSSSSTAMVTTLCAQGAPATEPIKAAAARNPRIFNDI